MLLRRAFWYWQFAAALALPLWVLVGYAVWGAGTAGFLTVAILAPLLVVAQLGLAALITARRSVRLQRAPGWADVGVLAAFSLAVIGAGFFGPATVWFGVLAVAALLGGYWITTIELAREVRTRVRTTLTALGVRPPVEPRDAGEYIVLPPPPKR
jgi:hypothetical protein